MYQFTPGAGIVLPGLDFAFSSDMALLLFYQQKHIIAAGMVPMDDGEFYA